MVDEPTIEEVKEAIAAIEQSVRETDFDGRQYATPYIDDLRTLLASHASLEAWDKEAKRLMQPFAEVVIDYDDAGLALDDAPDTRVLGRIARKAQDMAPCVTWADLRALAAFVNEKERT